MFTHLTLRLRFPCEHFVTSVVLSTVYHSNHDKGYFIINYNYIGIITNKYTEMTQLFSELLVSADLCRQMASRPSPFVIRVPVEDDQNKRKQHVLSSLYSAVVRYSLPPSMYLTPRTVR